jgi:hypothetical protein
LFSGTFHSTLITVSQDYQYNKNPAYQFGAQAVATNFSYAKQLSAHNSMFLAGWGGVTILGAIDSIPLGGIVEVPVDPEAGQGVSTGPRYYDYGPGGNVGAFFTIRRDNRPLLNIGYELHHLHILDGVRANHMLQRIRGDFMWPLKGRLGIGTTGEFFERKTFYDDNQGIGFTASRRGLFDVVSVMIPLRLASLARAALTRAGPFDSMRSLRQRSHWCAGRPHNPACHAGTVWPTRNPCRHHRRLPGHPWIVGGGSRQRCSAIAPTARPTPICTRAGSWPLLADRSRTGPMSGQSSSGYRQRRRLETTRACTSWARFSSAMAVFRVLHARRQRMAVVETGLAANADPLSLRPRLSRLDSVLDGNGVSPRGSVPKSSARSTPPPLAT